LSFALVPFQAWAAFKGLISKDEGPWFRTPKTGLVTDEVRHLRRLYMLRRWLRAPRVMHPTMPVVARATLRAPSTKRWLGWIVAGALVLLFGGLALASTQAPVVNAAGNPLYLHGTGTAPGCTASTADQAVGTRTTACEILSGTGATTWTFGNLPAQTVAAGVWSFTMYWTGGTGNTADTVAVAAGTSLTASCAGFVPTVPGVGTWSTTYGSSGTNTTSPFTVSTSASQLPMVITSGGSLCIRVTLTHNTGGKPSMVYDGVAGAADTSVLPPSIIVPESLLGLLGFAAIVPLLAGRLWRRRV